VQLVGQLAQVEVGSLVGYRVTPEANSTSRFILAVSAIGTGIIVVVIVISILPATSA
jgi:hypothetical protein